MTTEAESMITGDVALHARLLNMLEENIIYMVSELVVRSGYYEKQHNHILTNRLIKRGLAR